MRSIVRVLLPLSLGGGILYWMYRDFDFGKVEHVLLHDMDWTWMLLSFPFGILAQAFRGWRWRQTLEPIGEKVRAATSVNAIFLSYAVSLVIPRVGEFARCGVLKRYDGVSFPKAIGTVVTERAIDSLLLLLICVLTVCSQFTVFDTFFNRTGMRLDALLASFTQTGYMVTLVCALAAVLLLCLLFRHLSIYNKVKATIGGIWQGVVSLKQVKDKQLFLLFTVGIWLSYFLHYYLTFFCFESTARLGSDCALVTFIVGSMAVIVPTPNGAGPWHFAVKTMLILYGVAADDALYFVLIVHSVQTLLIVALGIAAWMALTFTAPRGTAGNDICSNQNHNDNE